MNTARNSSSFEKSETGVKYFCLLFSFKSKVPFSGSISLFSVLNGNSIWLIDPFIQVWLNNTLLKQAFARKSTKRDLPMQICGAPQTILCKVDVTKFVGIFLL